MDAKLEDVPDMGYSSRDEPYPRGELLVKTKTMFMGYFNNPEATKEAFDEEGYYHTGDIVELGPGRRITVIDRRKSFFKAIP